MTHRGNGKGSLRARPRGVTPEDWFHSKYERNEENGCLEWTWRVDDDGYGRTHRQQHPILAHRYAWILANGPIPEGLYVLHHCDNRRCGEPTHLFLGTQADNLADMKAKGRGRWQKVM